MSHYRATLAVIVLALTAAAGAAAQDFGGGTPESRYFRVDSTVSDGKRGPQLEGYVYNVYDTNAVRLRLRVEPLDSAGRALESRLVPVSLDVPARGRAFFRAPMPAGTASARVTVNDFDWAPRGAGGAM